MLKELFYVHAIFLGDLVQKSMRTDFQVEEKDILVRRIIVVDNRCFSGVLMREQGEDDILCMVKLEGRRPC